ncbi:hypothetical protein HK097_011671 [Rhizophlyctis rosea]|uniref:Uncharacterized protein n=1 Tax=Rhizophlyctis rosea TaxID=64517 RepID=A0AAD5X7Q4_9FUNG|nr:hypothetical protein HK097_011671 [Rhizophlyctis rosea]
MKFAEALQAYRNTIVAFEKVLAKADAVDAGLAAERRAAIIAARNAKLNPVDGADNTATSPPSRPKRKRPRRGPLRDTERKRLIELRDTYIKRVDILLSHLPPEFSAMYNAPTKSNSSTTLSRSTSLSRIRPSTTSSIPSTESTFESVLLEDPTIHEQPPTPPSDPTRHPFYLMRLLHQTMTVGGYLTPSLYVPRQLWFQSGARFVAIEAKLVACEQLLVYLTKLRQIGNTDVVTLQRELVEFESAVDGLRKDLTRKLRFIDEGVGSPLSATTMTPKASPLSPYPPDITSPVLPSSASILSTSSSTTSTNRFSTWSNKLSKSMEKLNIQRKTDRVLDSTSFIDLLVRLFEQSRVLADWLDALENGMLVGANPGLVQELVGRLGRISAFFGMVVVPFVLRDFEMLLERFLKKMRQVAVA